MILHSILARAAPSSELARRIRAKHAALTMKTDQPLAPDNYRRRLGRMRQIRGMKVASQYGDMLGGVVIVDSPIRSPDEEARYPLTPPPVGNKRVYETFDAALARFRLMPEQLCDNRFIVEFIGRHSPRCAEHGWVWKFDSEAVGSRRFGEPVREYLQAVGCRAALIFW